MSSNFKRLKFHYTLIQVCKKHWPSCTKYESDDEEISSEDSPLGVGDLCTAGLRFRHKKDKICCHLFVEKQLHPKLCKTGDQTYSDTSPNGECSLKSLPHSIPALNVAFVLHFPCSYRLPTIKLMYSKPLLRMKGSFLGSAKSI